KDAAAAPLSHPIAQARPEPPGVHANVSRFPPVIVRSSSPVQARQAWLWIGMTLLSCTRSSPPGEPRDGAPSEKGASRVARLLLIENRRVAGGITEDDIS